MTDTTTIFWIGLTLGCFIGGIVGFLACAVLTNEKEAVRAADSEKIVQEGIWRAEHELRLKAELKCMALQDKVSALYCPQNNHVWKDGICVKCGKEQDNGMD